MLRRHVLVLLAIAAASVASCADSEVVTAAYATLAEAQADGAVERGFLPSGLPPGTFELRSAHNLDGSRRWGLFNFPQSEREILRALLGPGDVSLAGVTIDIPGRIEWWPVLLRGALDPDRIRATGLRAHRSAKGELMFLVNWDQGRAYFWK